MAIQLEFINFIVPINTIKEMYPGGWEQCLIDYKNLIGGRVWYDKYLFRDGAMNPMDVGHLVEKWKQMGFQTHKGGDAPVEWVDVCVVEAMFGGATLPCDWIEVAGNVAYIKNKPKSEVVGRKRKKEVQKEATKGDAFMLFLLDGLLGPTFDYKFTRYIGLAHNDYSQGKLTKEEFNYAIITFTVIADPTCQDVLAEKLDKYKVPVVESKKVDEYVQIFVQENLK